MNILFVDTETTGLPVDETRSFKDIDNWPSIRQIAWLVYTKKGTKISEQNFITLNESTPISIFSTEYLPKKLSPIHSVLPLFIRDLKNCDVIIGHNIQYDVNVILCELYRLGFDTNYLESIQQFCTMRNSVEVCGFETNNGNRFPKLQELYTKLFHRPFENAHDAYCDIHATSDCYWKLFNDGNLLWRDFPFLIDDQERERIAREYSDEADRIVKQMHSDTNNRSLLLATAERYLKLISNQKKTIGLKPKEYAELERMYQEAESKKQEAKSISYAKPLELYKKAAEFGDSYSMYRIGSLYYYYLDDKNSAIKWYIKAINNGYVNADCYYEYANVSTRLYGSQSEDGPIFFKKWARLCETQLQCATISRRNLDLYIEAFEYGRYGQQKDIHKAIDICKRAISHNRPEFGKTEYKYGIRYTLASFLKQIGDKEGVAEQYVSYFHELKEISDTSLHYTKIGEELIRIFFDGVGVPTDYSRAKQYIDDILSNNESNSLAKYYLGEYYENGFDNCEVDKAKAFQYYLEAAEKVPEAKKRLGIMYLSGIECEKDETLALDYLSQAKDAGLDVAEYLDPLVEKEETRRKEEEKIEDKKYRTFIIIGLIVICVLSLLGALINNRHKGDSHSQLSQPAAQSIQNKAPSPLQNRSEKANAPAVIFEDNLEEIELLPENPYIHGGTKEVYYKNGQVRNRQYYVGDALKSISYFPDGTLKSEEWYRKGEKDGTCVYFSNGRAVKIHVYRKGKLVESQNP
jgi:TPR repeat protein